MQRPDSDFAALTPPMSRAKKIRRDLAYLLQTVVLLGGLVGGGISIGYYAGVSSERDARVAEMDRMQKAHQFALERLTQGTAAAAVDVSIAATNVTAAAGAVTAAAQSQLPKTKEQK